MKPPLGGFFILVTLLNNYFMNIRPIQKTDNAFLATMIRNVFIEHNAPKEGTVYSDTSTDKLFELFQEPKSVLWVAEIDKQVVGCCGIYPTKELPLGCVELVKFYLDKTFRGNNIGWALLEKSMNSAKEFGFKSVYIESLPHFDKAVKMYEQNGFVFLNSPLGVSGHSSCNVWMLRQF